MAGEKTASIKLTVKSSAFKSGMKDASDTTKREAKSMGAALKGALADGVKGAGSAVTSLFSSIKSGIATLGGLAGGLSLVGGIKGAIEAESRYRHLAFAIKAGTGTFVNFRDIQKQVQTAALATGQSTEDLVGVYRSLFEQVGDQHFAADVMRSVGTAATASGEPVQTLAEIAGTLNEKFGITSGEMDGALASVLSLGNKGGVSVAQMGEKLGIVGAAAKAAGLQGQDGFNKVAALLNVADDSTGSFKKGISAVSGLIDTLGDKTGRTKALMKLGLDPGQIKGDAIETIGKILQKTGGSKDKLAVSFQGEQLKLLADLGGNYAKVFGETQGDIKTKTAAAVAAFNEQITAAGKSSVSAADIQAQAAEELQSPEKQIANALTKLEQAFDKPEIIDAIGRLAKSLPGLADAIGSVAGFAAEHPGLAVAGGIGAVAGKGFLEASAGSVIKAAFSTGAEGAAGTLAKGIAGAGGGLAGSFGIALAGAGIVAGLVYAIGSAIQDHFKEKKQQEYTTALHGGNTETGGADFAGNEDDVFASNERDDSGQFKVLHGAEARKAKAEHDASMRAWQASKEGDDAIAAAQAFMAPASKGPVTPDEARALYAPSAAKAAPAAPSGQRFAPADQGLLNQMLGRTMNVKITNPDDIGKGAAVATPGWAPRG